MVVAAESVSTVAWFTLGGTLGGVALTSAVALGTAILNHRWQRQTAQRQILQEHVTQLRQERREIYLRYWSAWNRLIHELRSVSRQVDAFADDDAVKEHVAQHAPELAAQARQSEREWREAADELLLIGGEAVVDAARLHIETTERKLDAAWRGSWHPDEGGAAYHSLNNAMRADLIQPTDLSRP